MNNQTTHACPHCSRQMKSDFDEDVGMWYECENCDYREQASSAAPSVTEAPSQWVDAGGHIWYAHRGVDCIECPHCGFMFAAIHTSNDDYDCPNCEGCPDATAPPPSDAAVEAAKEIVPDCLSRPCFIRGCGYDECWGCDEAVKERNRVAAIISKRCAVTPDGAREQGLNLLRQLVSGQNALRDLDVFACNNGEHDAGCKCFWEQCEAWAKIDAATPTAPSVLVDEVQDRMDKVVETAVEWHQSGREGEGWFDAGERLTQAIESLLELRAAPSTEAGEPK